MSKQVTTQSHSAVLTFPVQEVWIAAALDFTERLGEQLEFNSQECIKIRLAVEEIVQFIKEQALPGMDNQSITLTFESHEDGLTILLAEKGLPIDSENLPEFNPQHIFDSYSTEGLNLHLAKSVTDRLTFHNRGRDGMEIELFKQRSSSHVQHLTGGKLTSTFSSGLPPIIQASSVTIRPARENEALEISRCAFLTYGYTYEDYIYYPERINEMNQNGELHSLVAVDEDGRVMGHCALKFAPKRTDRAELGVLFVRPEYRKQGLGAKLWKATVDLSKNMSLDSIFCRSVTGHRASQLLALDNGFSDCTLFLAICPRDVELKGIGGTQQGKMDLMLQWKALQPPRTREIHPPDCYMEIVQKLYQQTGIPITLPNRVVLKQPNESEFISRIHRIPVLNIATIELETLSLDVERTLRWINLTSRQLCREKLDAIYLFINIEQPEAALIAQSCMQSGYIFAGISPNSFPDKDALVMQYLNLPEDPFANLIIETDTATTLLDFIYQEWCDREQ